MIMETKLNDNEVREVARMQQKIDTYETFIKALVWITFGSKDVTIPVPTETPLNNEMHKIWKWVNEHKNKQTP